MPWSGLGSCLGLNSVGTADSIEGAWAGWLHLWADEG